MRKLINIAGAKSGIVGLANDGTTWLFTDSGWQQLPEIPQPPKQAVDRINGSRQAAIEILSFLNIKAKKNFPNTDVNLGFIAARLKEGATVETCKQVIAIQCRKWRDDEAMREYLRPSTLFNREKFSQYSGDIKNELPGM